MRHVKTVLGLAVAVCAFGASAVPALAEVSKEFQAERVGKTFSESEPGRTKGASVGALEFRLGSFTINCPSANAKGAVISQLSKTLFETVHYKKCETLAKFGAETVGLPTRFTTPVNFEYHQNGLVETGSENEEEVTISGGEVTLAISGIKCGVSWPSQTFPVKIKKGEEEFFAGSYTNEEFPSTKKKLFPSGEQKKLLVTTELKKVESTVSGEKCENFKHETTATGHYKGTFLIEVPAGNLSLVTPVI
jgi:hypothetical protein